MTNFPGKIFDTSSASVMAINTAGEIIWINASFQKNFGYDLTGLQQTAHGPFPIPLHREYFSSAVEKAISGNPVEPFDTQVVCSDNSIKTVRWSSMLVHGDSGSAAVAFSGLDLSDLWQGKPEHRQVEELFRQSEEKFMKIFMTVPDGISISRMEDGLFIDANTGFEEITGWARSELVGKSSLEFDFWADPAERETLVAELRAGREVLHREFQFRHRQGALRCGIYSARSISIDRDACFILAIQDISQQKETQRILKEKEEQMRAITANLPGAVYQFYAKDNGEYGISYMSKRLTKIFGLPTEDMNDFFPAFLAHVHEEDRERFVNSVREAIQKRSPWNFEGRFVKPAGDIIWIHGMSIPARQADRLVFDGILLDITERKQTEEKFRQSEEKFVKIFMTTPDGIAITRLKGGVITDINNGFEEITGWKRHEVIGRPSLDLNFWANPAERTLLGKELSGGRDILQREFLFHHRDGTLRNGIYSARRTRIANEVHVIFVVQDVTQRKETERALREKENTLLGITRNMPGTVFQFYIKDDGKYAISYISDRVLEFFDLPKTEEAMLESFLSYLHDEDRERFITSAWQAIETRRSWNFEGRIVRSAGEVIWFHGRATPTREADRTVFNGILLDITERKQAEEKFFNIFMMTPDCIAITRMSDGLIADVNLGFEEMTGWKRYEVIGKTSRDINFWVNPEDRDYMIHELTQGRDVLHHEFPFHCRDGSVHTGVYSARSIRFADEVFLIFLLQDITDRRRLEHALQESELLFRDLAEKSIVGVYLIQDDLFKYVNLEVANIFGASPEEIINRLGPKDVTHPEDLPIVEENARKKISGEQKSNHYEFRLIARNRQLRYVEVFSSGTIYRGKPAIIGTILDITNRKKDEEELRRLSFAIEKADEDILITDAEGIIQYVNPAFEKITGYSREEAIGQTPRLLKSGIHDKLFYKQLWDTVRSGKIWNGRIINRCKDGRLIYEDAMISPLLTAADKLTGYVALKRDVTETVRLETHLRQSQKMEAIGTLAGGIAHDFNNILGAMMGYAELIKFKTQDQGIYPYLEQILKACDRSRDLVKQILTFSRQREQEKKPVSVVPIVKEALKLLRSSIPATIEIRQHYDAAHDTVLADPTQIHQVMMNLCTNAVHAMRDREGILEVTIGQHELYAGDPAYAPDLAEGAYLELTVGDNGEGISAAIRDKIFDPFFTTKAMGEGTGLGLSVVYGIVKNHGGIISVDSEAGKGTVFTILLPLLAVDRKLESREVISAPSGKGRILYVDDEEPIASLGQEMLAALGYDVTVRFSSRDALEAFQARPDRFDLVITDMTMPNMTGASLAREILKVRPGLPIILTTGFSEQITEEEAKRIGIREFLMKPVSLPDLAQAVKKIIDEKSSPVAG